MGNKTASCGAADLEPIGGPGARHDLLADAGHHLRDVDGGALAAALTHDERAVVPVQRAHADLHQSAAPVSGHATGSQSQC